METTIISRTRILFGSATENEIAAFVGDPNEPFTQDDIEECLFNALEKGLYSKGETVSVHRTHMYILRNWRHPITNKVADVANIETTTLSVETARAAIAVCDWLRSIGEEIDDGLL